MSESKHNMTVRGEEKKQKYMNGLNLVSDCHTTLPGIKDGEFMGLGVCIHDDLEEAFILFTATI